MADKDANFVGIIALKDTALDQPGIVRLGPPPGNAGILIRGGAGWVFDRAQTKPVVDPRITQKETRPREEEVSLALAREMAYRWFYGRNQNTLNSIKSGKNASAASAQRLTTYTTLEGGFVRQFLNLRPGFAGEIPERRIFLESKGPLCQCDPTSACCGGACRFCEER
jgi:hypothetical protein